MLLISYVVSVPIVFLILIYSTKKIDGEVLVEDLLLILIVSLIPVINIIVMVCAIGECLGLLKRKLF